MEELRYISVRFETTNKTYTFSTMDDSIKNGDGVIVETQRGVEYGQVVSDPFFTPNINMEIKPILHKAQGPWAHGSGDYSWASRAFMSPAMRFRTSFMVEASFQTVTRSLVA